jgi:hypothetical protein
MKRVCHICGKPAAHSCDSGGCERNLCEEHATRRVSASPAPQPADGGRSPARGQAFCPEHAYLAQPLGL